MKVGIMADQKLETLLSHRHTALLKLIAAKQRWHAARVELLTGKAELQPLIGATITEHDEMFHTEIIPMIQEVERLFEAGHSQQIPKKLALKTQGLFELQRLTNLQRGYRAILNDLDREQLTTFHDYLDAQKHHQLLVNITEDLMEPEAATALFYEEQTVLAQATLVE